MAAQAGKNVLIKVEDDASPASYTVIGGLRSKTISFNGEPIDVTNDDSSEYRELLDGAGIRSCEISGSGVFNDTTSHDTVQDAWESNTLLNYQFTIPDFRTVEGKFKVTQISYAGEYEGEATYDMTFMSAGALSFADV